MTEWWTTRSMAARVVIGSLKMRSHSEKITLQAVAVPPGDHTVELRFESDALALGILITSSAVLLLALLGLVVLLETRARLRKLSE